MDKKERIFVKDGSFWKIFDVRNMKPTTFFHGIAGSRTLPLDTWIQADVKPVSDGSKGTIYESGIHLLADPDACLEYLTKFSNIEAKTLVRVEAQKVWRKQHSRSTVFLAEKIYISTTNWENRIDYIR